MNLYFDQETSEVAFTFDAKNEEDSSTLYWSFPPQFHGNKVSTYLLCNFNWLSNHMYYATGYQRFKARGCVRAFLVFMIKINFIKNSDNSIF